MKKMKQVLCTALLLALVLSLCAVSAEASNMQSSDQWNIMLLIDGSGSMDHTNKTPSDPLGLRYYAVANFLGTLNDDSVNVGAIVFTANYSSDTSDKAMQSGIKCNTGLLPLADSANKDRIMNQIDPAVAYCMQDAQNYNLRGDAPQTDIGTALMEAYRTLEAAPHDGRKSAIFLFTDGETEVNKDIQSKSQQNRDNATQLIRDNGVVLCGVYLNNGQPTGNSNEVYTIVQQANGLSASDGRMRNLYMEIRDARDCIDATDMFLSALGYEIKDESEPITSSVQKSFTVPGVGVLDATIRLYTLDGNPLPDGLNVRFQKPNQEMIEGAAANALCFSWASSSADAMDPRNQKLSQPISRVYKLKNPDPGTWTVFVDVPEGNTVEIRYSPSFNVDIGAELESIPDPSKVHANMDVQLNAYLTQGARLTDPQSYNYYSCRLMYQIDNNPVQILDMTDSKNGYFTVTMPVSVYGTYKVWAEFTSEGVTSFRSQELTWDLSNLPPQIVQYPEHLTLTYGLFQPRETEVDLSPCAIDPEDGTNVTYVIGGGSCKTDAVRQVSTNGAQLVIDNKAVGSGHVLFKVYDTEGAGTPMSLDIKTRNMTPIFIGIMAAALLAIAAAVILTIRRINRPVDGRCTLNFHVGDTPVSLDPAVPGTGDTKRSTDMLAIVNSVVRPEADGIDSDKLDQVRQFVQEHASELRSIKVSTTFGKVKADFSGKKDTVGMLHVRGKGLDVKLYNRSVQLVDGLFEFGFYPPEEPDYGYDDYNEGSGDNSYTDEGSYGNFDSTPSSYDGGGRKGGSYSSYDSNDSGTYSANGGYSSSGSYDTGAYDDERTYRAGSGGYSSYNSSDSNDSNDSGTYSASGGYSSGGYSSGGYDDEHTYSANGGFGEESFDDEATIGGWKNRGR